MNISLGLLKQRLAFPTFRKTSLAPRALEEAKAWAEAEAIDTDREGCAAAVEEMLEERLQADGAGDGLIDFDEFAGGEFFPARADWRVVAEAVKKQLDFAESEAHVGGKADEQHAVEGVARVAALVAGALWRGEEAAFFVVADGRGVEAGGGSKFTDFHEGVPGK